MRKNSKSSSSWEKVEKNNNKKKKEFELYDNLYDVTWVNDLSKITSISIQDKSKTTYTLYAIFPVLYLNYIKYVIVVISFAKRDTILLYLGTKKA